jgi:hypothetical protein
MSTLKTNNIEHLDASTPSIQTTIGGGTILAGVSTVSDTLKVGTGITFNTDGSATFAGPVSISTEGNIILKEGNTSSSATSQGGIIKQFAVGISSLTINSASNATTGTSSTCGSYIYTTSGDGGYTDAVSAQETSYCIQKWQRNGVINNGFLTADQQAIWSLGRHGTVNSTDPYTKLNLSLRSTGDTFKSISFKSDGTINLPSGGGIDFSATSDGSGTSTSELFDDYEEGTWIPNYTSTATNPVLVYNSTTAGYYTKTGRVVNVSGRITVDSVTSPGSGSLQISNLPFTIANSQTARATTMALYSSSWTSAAPCFGLGTQNTGQIRLYYWPAMPFTTPTSISTANLNATCTLYFAFTYIV